MLPRPCLTPFRDDSPVRPGRTLLWLCLAFVMCGCAGYRVGNQSLYRPDVQTVAVPVFESSSFRRQFAERLTEAVAKKIEARTPYKLAAEGTADSVLRGRIVGDSKRVMAEDRNDVPRNLQMQLVVQIEWQSPQGDLLRPTTAVPLPPTLQLSQAATLIPEAGQSVASSQQRAIEQLAEQIVSQLEFPW